MSNRFLQIESEVGSPEHILSPEITSSEFFSKATAEIFKNQSAAAASKLMRENLNHLVAKLPHGQEKDQFQTDMRVRSIFT